MREVGAELRTKILDAQSAGSDVSLFSTLRASDLTAREVAGMVSPNKLYHVGVLGGTSNTDIASSGAKLAPSSSGIARENLKSGPTSRADFLGTPISTFEGAKPRVESAGLGGEGRPTRIADMLDWHNKIIAKSGTGKPVDYRAGNDQPSMPYEKTESWMGLSLRRMLRWASENGYDRVAWTTGEMQAGRYDLSKQVNRIVHEAVEEAPGVHFVGIKTNKGKDIDLEVENGKVREGEFSGKSLDEIVGKELAEKILSTKPGQGKTYSGLDLKVGGEGMKGFYDKMIPQYLDKYGKRWGAKVEPVEIPIGGDEKAMREAERSGDSRRIADALGKQESVQSIPITEAMRKSVVEEGQPLFQKPAAEAPAGAKGSFQQKDDKFIITLFKGKADVTTWMHEKAHLLRRMALGEEPSAAILKWTGQPDWNVKAEEKFARGWERYLYNGRAPRKDMEAPMATMKKSFRKVYEELPDSMKDDLPPEIRLVYDNLLLKGKSADQERVQNLVKAIKKAQPTVAARLMAKLQQEFSDKK
jgi:hypothetical protein